MRRRAVGVVAGCTLLACALLLVTGNPALAAERLRLEIWGNTNHLDALKPLIEEYNASQERIEVVIPGKTENPDVVLAAALAGQLPDILESGRVWNNQYYPEGLMIDLEGFIAREGSGFLDDWIPYTLWTDNAVDGRLVSLPFRLEIFGMHYNETLFAQAGLPEPPIGWTWADVEDYARKVRRVGSDGRMEVWGVVAEHPLSFDYPLMGQAGGPAAPSGVLVDAEFQPLVNSAHVRETYDWILSMVGSGLLGYGYANIHPGANDARMHNAGMLQSGPQREQLIMSSGSALKPAPPLRARRDTKAAATYADRSLAIMNVSPERQEAAWEVIKWLFQPEVQARWNLAMGTAPATISALNHPVYRDEAQPNILRWAELYAGELEVQNAIPWPMPVWVTGLPNEAYNFSARLIRGEIGLEEYVTEFGRTVRTHMAELMERLGSRGQ